MNCCVVPKAIDGVAGVIAIDTNVALVTVSVVDTVTIPEAAVMFAVPWLTLLANPCAGAVLLIVATAGVFEVHSTVSVMFWVVPSE